MYFLSYTNPHLFQRLRSQLGGVHAGGRVVRAARAQQVHAADDVLPAFLARRRR